MKSASYTVFCQRISAASLKISVEVG